MSLWDRIRAVFRSTPPPADAPEAPRPGRAPSVAEMRTLHANAPPRRQAPSLAEMRALLRAGMTSDEFFTVLDQIVVERGLQMSMPTNDKRLIGLPVAEGGELLCFLHEGVLSYVEYKGDVFLEKEDDRGG